MISVCCKTLTSGRMVSALLLMGLMVATPMGCRSTAGLFGNEGSDVKSEVVWLVQPPELETPPPPGAPRRWKWKTRPNWTPTPSRPI